MIIELKGKACEIPRTTRKINYKTTYKTKTYYSENCLFMSKLDGRLCFILENSCSMFNIFILSTRIFFAQIKKVFFLRAASLAIMPSFSRQYQRGLPVLRIVSIRTILIGFINPFCSLIGSFHSMPVSELPVSRYFLKCRRIKFAVRAGLSMIASQNVIFIVKKYP